MWAFILTEANRVGWDLNSEKWNHPGLRLHGENSKLVPLKKTQCGERMAQSGPGFPVTCVLVFAPPAAHTLTLMEFWESDRTGAWCLGSETDQRASDIVVNFLVRGTACLEDLIFLCWYVRC